MTTNIFRLCLPLFILAFSCKPDQQRKSASQEEIDRPAVEVPPFNADSAYLFVEKQVAFAPRVPNSKAHQNTAEYLSQKLTSYGGKVMVQQFSQTTFDGQTLNLKNIIAAFYPEKQKRILLAAHWDTRPFADKDKQKPNAPFDGANDGASGVGVLLEIARTLSSHPSPVGIDIILFDGEDWGETEDAVPPRLSEHLDSWWCLGSQYWSKNKHQPNYSAYYGILLDMVGARNAQFHREDTSMKFAPSVVKKVWDAADALGYSHVFVRQDQGAITDDDVFVNMHAKIPMINIVQYDPSIGFFGSYHHTTEDGMNIISKETLEAVGKTVLYVLYNEKF